MMIPDGAKVPHANYCVPRVEIELAFVLGKPLKGPRHRTCSTCCARPSTWCRRWRSSTRACSNSAQDLRHRGRQRRGGRHRHAAAGPIRPDGRRPALGRRHHVPQLGDRGDGPRRGRARPSGARRGLARQPPRPERRDARSRAPRPRRLVHARRIRPEGRHPARRLRPAGRRRGAIRHKEQAHDRHRLSHPPHPQAPRQEARRRARPGW